VTDTVVSSATKELVIGFDRPFVIIGERINPTGRKKLADQMRSGDFSTVSSDALAQVEAGAAMLDVNAGIPLADEPAILARAVKLVQSLTDVPLSIDSSIVAALEAGLRVYQGKALVNSVTGEDERLEAVLPLVAKYGAAVVAITNDETGISEDPDVRFEVARKIVSRAADHGIGKADVVVDPLVMPIGAMNTAGRQVFHLVGRLRPHWPVDVGDYVWSSPIALDVDGDGAREVLVGSWTGEIHAIRRTGAQAIAAKSIQYIRTVVTTTAAKAVLQRDAPAPMARPSAPIQHPTATRCAISVRIRAGDGGCAAASA